MSVEGSTRVCPFCGEPPGPGVFCASCGRNLADVAQLPTRAGWAADGTGRAATVAGQGAVDQARGPVSPPDPAIATADFLRRMAAAGNPGIQKFPFAKRKTFERAGKAHCWIVRPVDREDFGERAGHYVEGIVLTAEGAFHPLDSKLTGYGQRSFPSYWHTVRREPADPPPGPELQAALGALLAKHGLAGDP